MAGKKGRSGGARAGAGAPRGMRKTTVERLEQARLHEEARRAETELEKARAAKKKLAKEILEDFMFTFAGMAAFYQPTPPNSEKTNLNADEERFCRYGRLAVDTAAELAKYQSPSFKAMAWMPPMPPPPEPKAIQGKVINLDDPMALSVAYRRMLTAGGGR